MRDVEVNFLSATWMIVFVVGSFPASLVLRKYGLMICLRLSSLLMAAGSWLRMIAVGTLQSGCREPPLRDLLTRV